MKKIRLKVITRARKEEVLKIKEDEYRIKVSCPPEKGKANQRITELLSERLGIRKNRIRIASGETNNKKIIEIDNG